MDLSILIADDDRDICDVVAREFRRLGYNVKIAMTPASAMSIVREDPIDCAIVDVNFTLDGKEGLDLITQIHRESPGTFIVVLSVVSNPDDIVAAIRNGAQDYITKDTPGLALKTQLGRTSRHFITTIHSRHLQSLQKRIAMREATDFVGESENVRSIRSQVKLAHAGGLKRFVVIGPNGSGKRAVANYIIAEDPSEDRRSPSLAITYSCASARPEMAPSELFGIAKSSGLPNVPSNGKPGAFAEAKGGYIVIDDFQDLPAQLYTSFLEIFDRNEVRPVGAPRTEKVDYRSIVTTQRPLTDYPDQLHYRLKKEASVIQLLPLSERREDILPLARRFLLKLGEEGKVKRPLSVSGEVESSLTARSYPGNVRELENLIFELALAETGDVISARTYEALVAQKEAPPGSVFASKLDKAEENMLRQSLNKSSGNVDEAAKDTGLDPQAFRRRAKKYGIPVGQEWLRQREAGQ